MFSRTVCATAVLITLQAAVVLPQSREALQPGVGDYVLGPSDTVVVTGYDHPTLTGRFTIERDGTFTYPLIGRVALGGMTLRQAEHALKTKLADEGFFKDPQISVAVEEYRSQRVFVVGDVRTPGAYALSGDMRVIEVLALAGSLLPTASGEAVIVPSGVSGVFGTSAGENDASGAVRVDLRALEKGDLSQNLQLRNGDTVFVPRVENFYVFGQVKSPGAYPFRERAMTVLQALSVAGGTTDRAAIRRVRIVRLVDAKRVEVKARTTDLVLPSDTLIVPERVF